MQMKIKLFLLFAEFTDMNGDPMVFIFLLIYYNFYQINLKCSSNMKLRFLGSVFNQTQFFHFFHYQPHLWTLKTVIVKLFLHKFVATAG